jgi:recombination endonuclease VII
MSNCACCGAALVGQQRKWCGQECQRSNARAARLLAHFDITPEEYDSILAEQGGVCAVCKKPPKPDKRLAVDHNHLTGLVRGLLCFFDNKRVLGARSERAIIALAEYVKDPPAQRVIGERIAPGRPKKSRSKRRRKRAE